MFIFLFYTILAFFALTSVALAGPIAAAFSFIGSIFAAGGVAGALLKGVLYVALSIGASLLQKALAKKPSLETGGTNLEIQMGDDVPASFPVGKTALAGRRKYIGTWGSSGNTPNAYLVDVIEFSSLPTIGNPSFWASEQKLTVLFNEPHEDGRGYPVLEYRKEGKDYLWVKWYLGNQTTADPYLVSKFQGTTRSIDSNFIGIGCSYAIFTCKFDQDVFSSGLPQWLIEPGSIGLYDPRRDDTVGGLGPQRYSDPSTWEPSDNPMVIIYNIVRGIRYGSQWIYGGQNVGVHRWPLSNAMAAMNACDEIVDGEKAYRAGANISVDVLPIDAINDLLNGCSGRMAEVGGFFKAIVGVPGASVFSFSDNEVIITKGQSYEPFPNLNETFNGITAQYPEPLERWETKDAPARYMPDLEAEDGNRRLASGVQFPTVPFGTQVQRLMLAMIKEYRRFRIHQFWLPPVAYVLEPNDVVSYTSAKNGYTNKKFVVLDVEGHASMAQLVTLKEVDPSDYDWNPSDKLDTDFGWIGPITPPPQTVKGWSAIGTEIRDSNGKNRRAAILVSCADDVEGVSKVWVQAVHRETGQTVFDSDQIVYAAPFSWYLDSPLILNNQTYLVRGRYISEINNNQQWSDYIEVLTPDIRLDPYSDIDTDALSDFLGEADEWIGWNTREEIEKARKLMLLDVDQDVSNYKDKQQVRQEITSSYGNATAYADFAITVATGPGSAIAQSILDLTAKVDNDIANAIQILTAEINTVEGQVEANANAITQLTAQVGQVESSVTIRGEAMASPGGGFARYGVQVKTGTGNNWSTAAFFMDANANTGVSRVVFQATQFVITDPSGNLANPFVFQDGIAYMQNARIGTVYFNELLSLNGKLSIRGYGNFSDIRIFT